MTSISRIHCRHGAGRLPHAWSGRVCGSFAPFLIGLLLCCFIYPLCDARAQSYSEADLRAVFLLNFSIFIDWPAEAFEAPSSPFRYCVLGSQVLTGSLRSVLAEETLGQRQLRLIAAEDPSSWRRCHIIYLDDSASQGRSQVLNAVKGMPVLTVGDSEAFARSGGMIGLVRKGGKLRAVINREMAEREGIRISSKLLRLSILVSSEAGQ
ncbi:YfiR family protein [Thiorhodococcus mannitoliphagus]|uniref:YfiR family protein n=1 Tax=Thiorhodococcus mannitoliphagus TaxID=329406 RepID=A0A6P1E1C6_9GAMM|nr:YfiR family protein [Thiorhodococcus mannitoliphagus]NEX22856.1 YfiR family protein [Thiorhodococcus mannitoliphagus]